MREVLFSECLGKLGTLTHFPPRQLASLGKGHQSTSIINSAQRRVQGLCIRQGRAKKTEYSAAEGGP